MGNRFWCSWSSSRTNTLRIRTRSRPKVFLSSSIFLTRVSRKLWGRDQTSSLLRRRETKRIITSVQLATAFVQFASSVWCWLMSTLGCWTATTSTIGFVWSTISCKPPTSDSSWPEESKRRLKENCSPSKKMSAMLFVKPLTGRTRLVCVQTATPRIQPSAIYPPGTWTDIESTSCSTYWKTKLIYSITKCSSVKPLNKSKRERRTSLAKTAKTMEMPTQIKRRVMKKAKIWIQGAKRYSNSSGRQPG